VISGHNETKGVFIFATFVEGETIHGHDHAGSSGAKFGAQTLARASRGVLRSLPHYAGDENMTGVRSAKVEPLRSRVEAQILQLRAAA
jgi:hypothetical protein